MMFLFILGLIDLVAGLLLGLSYFLDYTGSGFIITLGIVMLIKGGFSMAAAGTKFLDPMGILDVVSGFFLVLLFFGVNFFFFPYIGVLLILKGMWSAIMGLVK